MILELTIHGKPPVGLAPNTIRKIVNVFGKKMKLKKIILGLRFMSLKDMAGINKSYGKKSAPTDVLSFGYEDRAGKVEGDILICVPYAKNNAKKQKVDFKEELRRLLIHGLLHLDGYDHATPKEEKSMFTLQEKILNSL